MPFTVRGTGSVTGGRVQLDASGSSQFVSGLLLAAARFDKGIEIVHSGPRGVPSLPHIDMTLATLTDSGVEAARTSDVSWLVAPGRIRARDIDIEPDLSNAAPFLAAALVTGGTVRVPGWPRTTTQPGDALRDLLAEMGADVSFDGPTWSSAAPARSTASTPTCATSASSARSSPSSPPWPTARRTCAVSPTTRLHETDRLAALATEINGLGGDVVEDPDGLHDHAEASARRALADVRRSPDGDRRRGARPGRRRGRDREHRHHPQDAAGLRRPLWTTSSDPTRGARSARSAPSRRQPARRGRRPHPATPPQFPAALEATAQPRQRDGRDSR